MNTQPEHQSTPTYELRVAGHLDRHWLTWFGSLDLRHNDDGTTTLRGPVVDQAELHGLLAKVRDLGVPLLSVDTTSDAGPRRPDPTLGAPDPGRCDDHGSASDEHGTGDRRVVQGIGVPHGSRS
jgi:hypothetical protein